MKALLDVNFLLALAWPNHQFHSTATRWFEKHENLGWATCVITQLGFIRLSSQPAVFGSQAKTPEEARLLLCEYMSRPRHTYFAEHPQPADGTEFVRIIGHQQVTDAYLVRLARFHRARLVSFDQRLRSLESASKHIEVVSFP